MAVKLPLNLFEFNITFIRKHQFQIVPNRSFSVSNNVINNKIKHIGHFVKKKERQFRNQPQNRVHYDVNEKFQSFKILANIVVKKMYLLFVYRAFNP